MNERREAHSLGSGKLAAVSKLMAAGLGLAAAVPWSSWASTTGSQAETCRNFVQPLGSARSGRLVFASSAGGVEIQGSPRMQQLYRARFEGQIPAVRIEGGVVAIRYLSFPFPDWLDAAHRPRAAIMLNGSIPWEIEFRGGLSRLAANLAGLTLRSLDLNCSASTVRITLPKPADTVYLYVAGSMRDVVLRRPAGVALRVQISGGGRRVTFDGKAANTAGAQSPDDGGIRWQTPGYATETDRYDLSISGSVSRLAVTTW
jgi:hypothetical protein